MKQVSTARSVEMQDHNERVRRNTVSVITGVVSIHSDKYSAKTRFPNVRIDSRDYRAKNIQSI